MNILSRLFVGSLTDIIPINCPRKTVTSHFFSYESTATIWGALLLCNFGPRTCTEKKHFFQVHDLTPYSKMCIFDIMPIKALFLGLWSHRGHVTHMEFQARKMVSQIWATLVGMWLCLQGSVIPHIPVNFPITCLIVKRLDLWGSGFLVQELQISFSCATWICWNAIESHPKMACLENPV